MADEDDEVGLKWGQRKEPRPKGPRRERRSANRQKGTNKKEVTVVRIAKGLSKRKV